MKNEVSMTIDAATQMGWRDILDGVAAHGFLELSKSGDSRACLYYALASGRFIAQMNPRLTVVVRDGDPWDINSGDMDYITCCASRDYVKASNGLGNEFYDRAYMLIYAAQLLRDKCLSQGLLKLPEGRKTTPSKFPVPTIESDVSRGSQTKTTVG